MGAARSKGDERAKRAQRCRAVRDRKPGQPFCCGANASAAGGRRVTARATDYGVQAPNNTAQPPQRQSTRDSTVRALLRRLSRQMGRCSGRPGRFLAPSLAGVTPAPMHPKTTCRVAAKPLVDLSGSARATSFQLAVAEPGPDLRQYYGRVLMGQCCILSF